MEEGQIVLGKIARYNVEHHENYGKWMEAAEEGRLKDIPVSVEGSRGILDFCAPRHYFEQKRRAA